MTTATRKRTRPKADEQKIVRVARLAWHRIEEMRTNPLAQREVKASRVHYLAANLDLEQIGTPTVNVRDDGHVYVIDGQHRIAALREFGIDGLLQCWTYYGLTAEEEAEHFLRLNNVLAVSVFDRYRIGIEAGRPTECDIDRILRSLDLRATRDKIPGAVHAVGTLQKVYDRSGPAVLSRSLRILRDAYGDAGMGATLIDGIGLLCDRYNGELDEGTAIARLGAIHGGAGGLLGRAQVAHLSTGSSKAQCVAAVAVEVVNRGARGGNRLPEWWKS